MSQTAALRSGHEARKIERRPVQDSLWTCRQFSKHSSRIVPFSLEESIPIAGDVPIFVSFRMVEKVSMLVCFWIVRGNDLITPAADVLFFVSDHEIPLLFVLRFHS
jgi:hypothetical protein